MNKLLYILLLNNIVFAYNDLGIFGKTYVVQEQNALETLKKQSKDINKTKITKSLYSSLDRYMDVNMSIDICFQTKETMLDPTTTLENDIVMPKYNIRIKKGERFNPLDYATLNGYLMFIDATNKHQLELAKMYAKNSLIIVVKGNIQTVKNLINSEVYKAEKALIDAYNVNCVPSIYVQAEKKYKKFEYFLDGNSND